MDTNTKAAEILYRVLLWVPAEDRDLMIDGIRGEHGAEVADQVRDMYNVHAINGDE